MIEDRLDTAYQDLVGGLRAAVGPGTELERLIDLVDAHIALHDAVVRRDELRRMRRDLVTRTVQLDPSGDCPVKGSWD